MIQESIPILSKIQKSSPFRKADQSEILFLGVNGDRVGFSRCLGFGGILLWLPQLACEVGGRSRTRWWYSWRRYNFALDWRREGETQQESEEAFELSTFYKRKRKILSHHIWRVYYALVAVFEEDLRKRGFGHRSFFFKVFF